MPRFITASSAILVFLVRLSKAQDFVLDAAFVNRSIVAAELSILAMQNNPSSGGNYDTFQAFAEGDNRAIVAMKNGACFAAFSSVAPGKLGSFFGRIGSFFGGDADNFENECSATKCCEARRTVVESYRASFRNDVQAALRSCAVNCTDPNDCVVLTGHNEGAAGT